MQAIPTRCDARATGDAKARRHAGFHTGGSNSRFNPGGSDPRFNTGGFDPGGDNS